MQSKTSHELHIHAPHLIDGESHCVHVFAHFPHSSAVLLDHTHHQTAGVVAIIRLVIHLIQLDQKLRVGPEGVCGVSEETAQVRILRGLKFFREEMISSQGRQLRRYLRFHKVKCKNTNGRGESFLTINLTINFQ